MNIQNSLPQYPEVPDVVVGAVVVEVVVVGVAEVGKGFSGFNVLQLSCPQVRPSSHSSLLSQSPSWSLHLFSSLQHDHVFWSNVPLQSQDTSASKGAVRKLNELFVVKKILILMVSFVCYLAY